METVLPQGRPMPVSAGDDGWRRARRTVTHAARQAYSRSPKRKMIVLLKTCPRLEFGRREVWLVRTVGEVLCFHCESCKTAVGASEGLPAHSTD